MIPSVPANKDGTCPTGSHNVGESGSAGQPGTGSVNCIADKPSTPTQPTILVALQEQPQIQEHLQEQQKVQAELTTTTTPIRQELEEQQLQVPVQQPIQANLLLLLPLQLNL